MERRTRREPNSHSHKINNDQTIDETPKIVTTTTTTTKPSSSSRSIIIRKPNNKGVALLGRAGPTTAKPTAPSPVKLAAVAVDLNVRLRSADMPAAMQERAFRCARALMDAATPTGEKLNPTRLALSLKKEFDGVYGPAWHCVVGKSFGSFVTHSSGGFVYFSIDKLSFLLFNTHVRPVKLTPQL